MVVTPSRLPFSSRNFLPALAFSSPMAAMRSLGTFLQEGEGFGQLFIGELLLLLAEGVLDALGDGFRIQVVHAFLGQALAHVQADTIGSFLRRGLQLNVGLRIAAGENQTDQCDRCCQPMLFHAESFNLFAARAYSMKPRA